MASGQRLIMVDDTDPLIQFHGPWFLDNTGSQDAKGNYGPVYNGTQHGAIESASLSFSYNGSYFAVMGSTNIRNDSGVVDPQWDCFVDGVKADSGSYQFFENNWWLCEPKTITVKDGPHILTVNATISNSQTFWIDRIDYLPSPDVPLDDKTIFVDNHDSELQFGDGWGNIGTTANITRLTGSPYTFYFQGTSISWFSYLIGSTQNAVATWSIDDSTPESFTIKALPSGPALYNQELFRTADYPPGRHKLSVTYLGPQDSAALILDYLVVRNAALPTDMGTPGNGGNGPTTPPKGGDNIDNPPVHKSTSRIGPIVGGVLGSLALILAAFIVLVYMRRRQRKTEANDLLQQSAREIDRTSHQRTHSDMTSHPTFSNQSSSGPVSYQPVPVSSKFRRDAPRDMPRNDLTYLRYSDTTNLANHEAGYGSGSAGSPTSTATLSALGDASIHARIVQHQDSGARVSRPLNEQSPQSGGVLEVPPLYTAS